jgi:hypothetical protein
MGTRVRTNKARRKGGCRNKAFSIALLIVASVGVFQPQGECRTKFACLVSIPLLVWRVLR